MVLREMSAWEGEGTGCDLGICGIGSIRRA